MSENRRPEEVAVVVRRPGDPEPEYLVVLRSPEKLGLTMIRVRISWMRSNISTSFVYASGPTP